MSAARSASPRASAASAMPERHRFLEVALDPVVERRQNRFRVVDAPELEQRHGGVVAAILRQRCAGDLSVRHNRQRGGELFVLDQRDAAGQLRRARCAG